MTFLEAIAREEGWDVPNSRCRRNHNPGNIEFGSFAKKFGATGGDPRFAIFPSDEVGFACMKALFQEPLYKGRTVAEAIATWAPNTENDTSMYIANICLWASLTPNSVIDESVNAA